MPSSLFLTPSTLSAHADLQVRLDALPPFQPAAILMPTVAAIQDLQRATGDRAGLRMHQFYTLAGAVLDAAGSSIFTLNDSAVRRLLRRTLAGLQSDGQLTTFEPVWEKPGFQQVVLTWLREMKGQGIAPEDYTAHAAISGRERDRQLAAIYTRYQTYLHKHEFSDDNGLLWLAAEALEQDPSLFQTKGPLYVLGFDQFTPIQLRILSALADRFESTRIYMAWDAERSPESRALARLRDTRQALIDTLGLQVEALPSSLDTPSDLAHLQRAVFEDQAPASHPRNIRLVEAPSREEEVRHALRNIKRLLLQGTPPNEIALLAPGLAAYLPTVRAAAAEYGLPVSAVRPLLYSPVVQAFANLLRLAPDFAWRPVFTSLRSPYVRQPWLDPEQVDLLDLLSRERPVISGRDQWRHALRPMTPPREDAEDEDLGPPRLAATTPHETLAALEADLKRFFDHLSPPPEDEPTAYAWWLQTALLGVFPPEEPQGETETLDLLAACVTDAERKALAQVLHAIRRMLISAETIPDGKTVAWEDFRTELLELLRATKLVLDPGSPRVRFSSLSDGRARSAQHLFVLGLSEGAVNDN